MTSSEISRPPAPCPATIASIRAHGARAALVTLAPARPLRWRAGQVCEIGLGEAEETGTFAIANAFAEGPTLSFLIKGVGGVSKNLVGARPGDRCWIRQPHGVGFPLDAARGGDLLFVGVGTGVAPLRAAVVEALGERRAYGAITLLQGAREPGELYFSAEHPRWRAAGVRIETVVSRPRPEDRWPGRVGHVQEHLAELVSPTATAFVIGMRAMEREVRAALAGLGLPPARVYNNY